MNYPSRVQLVDVSPRDGLQNIAQAIPTATKIELSTNWPPQGCAGLRRRPLFRPNGCPRWRMGLPCWPG